MRIQPFRASYPDMGLISSADHFFSTVKEKFNEYWSSGYYQLPPQEGLFVCTIERAEKTHIGLIACIDVQEYIDGNVKRHEKTLEDSEQGQALQLLDRNAQIKPVMLAYRHVDEVENILLDYVADNVHFLEIAFPANGETHRFWTIHEQGVIGRLQAIFKECVQSAYIADGHHRISSNALMFSRMKDENPDSPIRWLPCSFFPTSEVEIYDFNRIIEGVNDFSAATFIARLSKLFEIELLEYAQKPTRKHMLTMYIEKKWYQLKWLPEILQAHENDPVILDVSLLDEYVLVGILGIQDVRTDQRVKYSQGTKTLEALEEKTLKADERFAFCLYPVDMEDFLTVADADGVLPPKSTWFEPRVRSGVLVRRFNLPEI